MPSNELKDPLPQNDNKKSPVCLAFRRFSDSIDPTDKNQFTDISILDVLNSVKSLDAHHASSSTCRSISQRIGPFIFFLERHAIAVDCMVQCHPSPAALIWGFCRIVLQTGRAFLEYFPRIISMIETLSDSISRYQQYEVILRDNERFQDALGALFFDTLVFLHKAKKILTSRGLKTLCRSVWKNFESDFDDIVSLIARRENLMEAEIQLAHHIDVRASFERCARQQSVIESSLSRIESEFNLRNNIMSWLSPLEMEEVYVREMSCRTVSSGTWLLEHERFQDWVASNHKVLWIQGPPGCGKTVLSTTIIDHLKKCCGDKLDPTPIFFFCDKSNEYEQSDNRIFGTLVAQIITSLPTIPDDIQSSYYRATQHGRKTLTNSDNPRGILRDLASSVGHLHIVIDGLDELKDPNAMLESLEYLLGTSPWTQLIFLSRKIPALNGRADKFSVIQITSTSTKRDIDHFISQELSNLPILDPADLNHCFNKLSHAANGSFLWTNLMLRSLKSATAPCEMNEILSEIPLGLDNFYTTIVNKLMKQVPRRKALARKSLLALCFAARPLYWKELQSLLACEASEEKFMESKMPFKSAVLDLSGSLFEYSSIHDSFHLTHSSVREYLLSSPQDHALEKGAEIFFFTEGVGHSELAAICVSYQLNFPAISESTSQSTLHPFLNYSTIFWCHHVCETRYDEKLATEIKAFITPKIQRQTWVLRYINWQHSTFPLQRLLRLQKRLLEWFEESPGRHLDHESLSWLQDVPRTLLCNTGHSHTIHISFFEKMMVIRDLSREYTMRGTLASGERWFTEALNDQDNQHGREHISTAWLMNALGIIYDQQKRTQLSCEIQERALAIQTSKLGPDHLETIWTVNELGRIYRHLYEFSKAESMHLRALAVLKQFLPPRDLQIAWTLNTLGRTYRRQRRFDQAIALHEEALEIQCDELGALHPHTLWAFMDKAACLLEQGSHLESLKLYTKAAEGREQTLGLKHADTLWALNNLGRVHEALGQNEAAISLHEKAMQGQVDVLGDDHPHTSWTRDTIQRLQHYVSVR